MRWPVCRERNLRLELRRMVVREVADDGRVERLRLLEADEARAGADEGVPAEAPSLDGLEQEAAALRARRRRYAPSGVRRSVGMAGSGVTGRKRCQSGSDPRGLTPNEASSLGWRRCRARSSSPPFGRRSAASVAASPPYPATELGSIVIRAGLERAGLDPATRSSTPSWARCSRRARARPRHARRRSVRGSRRRSRRTRSTRCARRRSARSRSPT